MKKIQCFPAVLLVFSLLAVPARAEEPVYCFQETDFGESLQGIYLEEIPEDGSLMLGSRMLRQGDVLTADQAEKMTYCSASGVGGTLLFKPISQDGVMETARFRIPGTRNQAPVAQDSALETYKNLPNMGTLRVRDPEEEGLTIEILKEPRRGTVTLGERNTFTYTPDKNKVGEDVFTYQAVDPAGNASREAAVTIRILKPSDSPLYQDTLGLSCSYSAEWMKNTGIFTAETLGDTCCFQPDKPVLRGEFLTMLLKTLDIAPEPELTAGLQQVPLWLQPYAAAALRAGLTAGLPAWEQMDREITGEEAGILARNAMKMPVETFLEDRGPGEVLTRGQAAQLLYELHVLKTTR